MAPSPWMSAAIPLDLVSVLNDTYFLHLLATDPSKVVPPGKSLVSMLQGSSVLPRDKADSHESIREKVTVSMHRAFWDKAASSLSSDQPSVQLERLKGLRHDVLEVIRPLLPPSHPVITNLESPLAPTSSPLLYMLNFLREIVLVLKQRCAPARDQSVESILSLLDAPIDSITSGTNVSPLADRFIQCLRFTLEVAEAMKKDIQNFILPRMSDKELHDLVVEQARIREQQLVLRLWSAEVPNSENELQKPLSSYYGAWIDGFDASVPGVPPLQVRTKWIARLMQALASPLPVSCDLPHYDSQNWLQALVIAAALRVLTRLPSGAKFESGQPGIDFMSRVWTLLCLEIEVEDPTGEEGTKIAHLADEVVRARRFVNISEPSSSLTAEEEKSLRASVERTLRVDDPVFVLLQNRLLSAVTLTLDDWYQCWLDNPTPETPAAFVMRSGRAFSKGLTPPQQQTTAQESRFIMEMPIVKGFEDTVLQEGIQKCLTCSGFDYSMGPELLGP
ncbi:hypothetical protein DL96DRAFT_1815319 [Flagelloscypha sp. PMI_526]|nr:hypothetical protein DL96DRAFT_1815319 [Flagelloscypha sp. PMI_526]